MIDSNGNKIADITAEPDYEFMIAEIKFMMKGFHKSPDSTRVFAVAGTIKSMLDNKSVFRSIESEERDYIENTVVELEDYADSVENHDLFWEMVYLRRRLANAYEHIGMMYTAVECKFAGALHFDWICTVNPTPFNYCARFFEYSNVVRTILQNKDVQDKWNAEKVAKLFVRAENFAESKSFLIDDDYLEGACYYYATKRLYYKIKSDNLSAYQAAGTEVYYLRERYRHGRSGDVIKDLIDKYIDYTKFEWYSYHNEKQHFKTLIEWARDWSNKENSSEANGQYSRLFKCYKSFWA